MHERPTPSPRDARPPPVVAPDGKPPLPQRPAPRLGLAGSATRPRRAPRILLAGAGGALALFLTVGIVASLAYFVWRALPPSHAEVYQHTTELVRSFLVAPKTAEFLPPGEVTAAEGEGGSHWRVAGQFDAQNGFGVFLRGNFLARVEYQSDRRAWVLHYAEIDGTPAHVSAAMKRQLASAAEAKRRAAEREQQAREDAQPWRRLAMLSGSGSTHSDPFELQRPPLRVKWQNASGEGVISISVRAWTGDATQRHIVVDGGRIAAGETVLRVAAGKYFLDVDATGEWSAALDSK